MDKHPEWWTTQEMADLREQLAVASQQMHQTMLTIAAACEQASAAFHQFAAAYGLVERTVVKQHTVWRFGVIRFAWRLWVRLRHALTGDCGCACGYVEPYGFVPECGCPIHDREG